MRDDVGKSPGNVPDASLQSGDETDADVGGRGAAALFHYIEGARAVIMMIVERFREHGRDLHDADTLVFPLGLQCRHLVELRLKELHMSLTGNWPHGHGLLELWSELRQMVEARWSDANRPSQERFAHLPRELLDELQIALHQEGALDRAEALVQALDEVDPRGLSFRYPNTIPTEVKAVSLEKLAEAALELDELLDGYVTAAYEEDSIHAEMRAEFSSES